MPRPGVVPDDDEPDDAVSLLVVMGALESLVFVGELGLAAADAADVGCAFWESRKSAKGCESVCWPLALVCVCGRAAGGAGMALTSGTILGVLDTATLPGDGNPAIGLQPLGQESVSVEIT